HRALFAPAKQNEMLHGTDKALGHCLRNVVAVQQVELNIEPLKRRAIFCHAKVGKMLVRRGEPGGESCRHTGIRIQVIRRIQQRAGSPALMHTICNEMPSRIGKPCVYCCCNIWVAPQVPISHEKVRLHIDLRYSMHTQCALEIVSRKSSESA